MTNSKENVISLLIDMEIAYHEQAQKYEAQEDYLNAEYMQIAFDTLATVIDIMISQEEFDKYALIYSDKEEE